MGVRRLLAALLLVPALVSCSDDEPSADPPSPPSSSVSTSVSETQTGPVEPVMPDAAKKPTKAGAIAFLEHYWAMVDYAEATGRTSGLAVLALPGCQRCTGGVQFLERMAKASGRIIGEGRTVRSNEIQLGRFGGALVATIRASIEISPSVEFYGRKNSKNKRWPGGTSVYEFAIQRSAQDAWQLAQWSDAR